MTGEGQLFVFMRLLLALLLVSLPFVAAGQSVSSDPTAQSLLSRQPDKMTEVEPGVVVPLWLGSNGHLLALQADNETGANAMRSDNSTLAFHVVDATHVMSSSLQYSLAPSLRAHVDVSQQSWVNQPTRIMSSELGATYDAGRYSLDLSIGGSSTPNNVATLPRVLPGAELGVDNLPSFDSSSQLNARGRFSLNNKSGIDVGASVGRIHLLPGNLLGISTVAQKALSFGVDTGPVSGTLIGRTMEPQAGMGANGIMADRHWNSIDLGVTWRLPWRGQLSVGAQNLWSSGSAATNTPAGPEPDQSRTPYVQYHQDL